MPLNALQIARPLLYAQDAATAKTEGRWRSVQNGINIQRKKKKGPALTEKGDQLREIFNIGAGEKFPSSKELEDLLKDDAYANACRGRLGAMEQGHHPPPPPPPHPAIQLPVVNYVQQQLPPAPGLLAQQQQNPPPPPPLTQDQLARSHHSLQLQTAVNYHGLQQQLGQLRQQVVQTSQAVEQNAGAMGQLGQQVGHFVHGAEALLQATGNTVHAVDHLVAQHNNQPPHPPALQQPPPPAPQQPPAPQPPAPAFAGLNLG